MLRQDKSAVRWPMRANTKSPSSQATPWEPRRNACASSSAPRSRDPPPRLSGSRASATKPPVRIVDKHGADQQSCNSRRRELNRPTSRMNGRQHADADPVDDGMDRAEHEIGRRAVPGAHLDLHRAHADGGRSRAARVTRNRPAPISPKPATTARTAPSPGQR